MGSRIARTARGEVRLLLPAGERELLRTVAEDLGELLHEDVENPSLRRLFPPAHDDPELEREYRDLTRTELLRGRTQALEVLRTTIDRDVLTPDEADAWLRALNDLRLVLGTRLGVTENLDWDAVDETHPEAHALAVYGYLSWLQEELVAASRA
ncbi:MAG: DUF2017 domain-containing protein [Actinomycetota bacterium]|nr:DUF2017 domain-containing protein [Actinomycetota bacterium]